MKKEFHPMSRCPMMVNYTHAEPVLHDYRCTFGQFTEYFRLTKEWFRCIFLSILTFAASLSNSQVLPKPDSQFQGKIDITAAKSIPYWPTPVTAPNGAPNIIIVLLDDVGFSATSTFGGAAPTPGLDQLAAGGLRYNRFHVTPMCAPTRAALLSGRNAHQVGFGRIPELAAGYPGYNSIWPKNSASLAQILKLNGYSTAAFGKWHNTPIWEVNPSGPFDRWPTGLGFEYFYGFIGYGTSQWEPNLYRNVDAVSPPTRPDEGYHLTTDLVNDAIKWLQRHDAVAASKPFFLYFAAGATHSPFQAPKAWVDKFRGKFDQGWDKLRDETFKRQKELGVIPKNAELTPRPEELVAWDSLSNAQKKLMARQMEVYAGLITHTDYEIGRLLDAIRTAGHADNTIVFFIADDNGPTAEGGFDGRDALTAEGKSESLEERWAKYDALGSEAFDNAPAAAWAWAVNSPFKGAKQVASDLGGIRVPMVVYSPRHIREVGGIRSQFLHATDIAPTIYELAGIQPPAVVNGEQQTPLEGRSFVYTFNNPEKNRGPRVQYFELFGSRGIYKDGWWAGSSNGSAWNPSRGTISVPLEQRRWELYNLEQDFSQAFDLSKKNPQKLEDMIKSFDAEAWRNNVYPLEPAFGSMPSVTASQKQFIYHEGVRLIPSTAAPRVAGRAHKITAEIDIKETGMEGVIVAQGGRQGGFTLYIKDGKMVYETNSYGHLTGSLEYSKALTPGKVKVEVEVTPIQSGNSGQSGFRQSYPMVARMFINGELAGEVKLRLAPTNDTLDIGSDMVSPVSPKYLCPFPFTGKIRYVSFDLL